MTGSNRPIRAHRTLGTGILQEVLVYKPHLISVINRHEGTASGPLSEHDFHFACDPETRKMPVYWTERGTCGPRSSSNSRRKRSESTRKFRRHRTLQPCRIWFGAAVREGLARIRPGSPSRQVCLPGPHRHHPPRSEPRPTDVQLLGPDCTGPATRTLSGKESGSTPVVLIRQKAALSDSHRYTPRSTVACLSFALLCEARVGYTYLSQVDR